VGEPAFDFSIGTGARDSGQTYQSLRRRVAAARAPAFWPAFPPQPPLSDLERAGVMRAVETIPGPCGEAKMHAVMEVMRHAPQGDIVEIGAGCGRTATLFLLLSQRLRLGKVLCIDPWATPVPAEAAACEEALRMFEVNLAPFAQGRLNYARAQSTYFAPAYGAGLTVHTDAFGDTAYAGEIAVLHLAGPSSQAQRDSDLWAPLVCGGGWILFDGGGDQRIGAAEAFAIRNASRIAARFEAGGSVFIQLKRGA
jgi:hypothetical protein